MFLPYFDVLCDLLLNRRTATWNLFVLDNKKHTTSAFYFNIFLNYSKAGLCPLWQTRKKAIWRNLLSIQNEAISLVAMHKKKLWLVKKDHALWAEKLECFLEYCWSWKNTLGKHEVTVNTGRHLIQVLNEKRATDGGNLCPLWLVILKLVWHGIGDTLWLQYSWPWAVASYTFLAVVPWNGLEHLRRKVGLRVYFNWIYEVMIFCFIPDINLHTCMSTTILRLRSWIF